jgi:hypothetical protein
MLPELATLTNRSELLGRIAVRLGEGGAWDEALAVIGDILDHYEHARASWEQPAAPIVELAQIAPRDSLTQLLSLALRLPEDHQARALPAILARLPRVERRAVLEQVLTSTSTELLATLAGHTADLLMHTVIAAWSRALRSADLGAQRELRPAKRGSQPEILDYVQALGPAIIALCGPGAAIAIYDELEAVERWWKVQAQRPSWAPQAAGQMR